MSRFQVHVAAPLHPAGWEILHHAADILICDSQTPTEFDAILVGPSIPVGQKLIENSSRLKVIACLGAQLEAIDLDFATRMGILVVHAPATAASAVVEYTFALLLALARRVPQGAETIREGRIPTEDLPGFQLTRKTLGIIGLGRIGRQVAVLAQAFGMHVVAYDPYIQLSRAHSQSIEMISFPELLARSDIITLHPAMTQETRGMLNQAAFELVNPGAILINCTHADLIDEIALLNALDSGRVAAAALDAFSPEPHAREHPLLQHPRVLATPHFNQNTNEAQASTSQQVVRDMLSALRDEDFNNIANLPFSDSIPYRLARPYIQLAARLGRLQGQLAGGRITRLEVELLGGIGASETSLQELVRPLTAMLLSGMLRPVSGRKPNWVSAPVLGYEQGISMAQINGLVRLDDYPNLIACRIYWETGHRTVAGVLFGNGEARLVQYDRFQVDAYPDGYVLILENEDVPGVIGKVGTRLGNAGINIAQWRYGRDHPGGKAVSFINLDSRPEQGILNELEQEPEIYRARLVRL